MTILGIVGHSLLVFGPTVAIFIAIILPHRFRIILFTLSCFFWICAFLLGSLIWFAVVPLRDQLTFGTIFSVLILQLSQFAYYIMLKKVESILAKVTRDMASGEVESSQLSREPSMLNWKVTGFVLGVGFALIRQLIYFINLWPMINNQATLMNDKSFFLLSSIQASCFGIFQIGLILVQFYGFEKRKYSAVAFALIAHLGMSLSALMNEVGRPHAIALTATWFVLTTCLWCGVSFLYKANCRKI